MPDELRSLDAKLSRALEAMCKRHGEQKNSTFYHALIQDMERYHAEKGSSMSGQMSLRKILALFQVDNFNADTWALNEFLRMRWLGRR